MQRSTVRTALALTAAGLLAASMISGVAGAAPAERSTPVTIRTPDGMLMSYIINAKNEAPGHLKQLERAVARSGGAVVQSWPEIGVVVAHSDREAFRADMVRYAGKDMHSMGPTRSIAVGEGTPEDVPTPWGPAAARTQGAQPASRSDLRSSVKSPDAAAVAVADPRESEQWALKATKADQAHQVTEGSRDVLVGILDTGVDNKHPDLAPNFDPAKSVDCTDAGRPDRTEANWSTGGHGTHVAGIVAAARNGIGVVGIAPNVRIASVKVAADWIYPEYVVCGMMWVAAHGFDITNNSYNIDPFDFWCTDQAEQRASVYAVQKAVTYARDKGIVHTAAAGNHSWDFTKKTTDSSSPYDGGGAVDRQINSSCKYMHSQLDDMVVVSATTQDGLLASFSDRGLGIIDVGAPGHQVLSTINGGGYAKWNGTSMAAPNAAGVLALMKSAHPDWTPDQLEAALLQQADDHICAAPQNNTGPACEGTGENNSYYGEGTVDALDAVR